MRNLYRLDIVGVRAAFVKQCCDANDSCCALLSHSLTLSLKQHNITFMRSIGAISLFIYIYRTLCSRMQR